MNPRKSVAELKASFTWRSMSAAEQAKRLAAEGLPPEVKRLSRFGAHNPYTPEFAIWRSMHLRCENPNDPVFKHYGGIGVRVCERWSGKDGYENFRADMGPRPEEKTAKGRALYSIGRFGDVGNYEPTNCKWMTWAEQRAEQRLKRLCEAP